MTIVARRLCLPLYEDRFNTVLVRFNTRSRHKGVKEAPSRTRNNLRATMEGFASRAPGRA